jgi:hypothetical protein
VRVGFDGHVPQRSFEGQDEHVWSPLQRPEVVYPKVAVQMTIAAGGSLTKQDDKRA